MNKPKLIKTKRLILKELELNDSELLIKIITNPLVTKTYMIPDFKTQNEAYSYFLKLMNYTKNEEHFVYGIFKDGIVIGFINDCYIENDLIELGYFIDPPYWHMGYASEALKKMIEVLFLSGFNRVQCAHFEENLRSGQVMMNCGMKRIDKEEIINYKGINHNCLYYEIKK